MQTFTKESVTTLSPENWAKYKKKMLTPALRIDGAFEVETKEGWPHPIAHSDFLAMYEKAFTTPE